MTRGLDAMLPAGGDWDGYLTPDNRDAVADRVRRMLTGKRFSIVDVNHLYTRNGEMPPRVELSVGNRMYANWVEDAAGDPNDPVHMVDSPDTGLFGFHVTGTRGLLFLTSKRDQQHAPTDAIELQPDHPDYSSENASAVYMTIKGMGEIRIVWRAPAGNRVETVIVVDERLESDQAEQARGWRGRRA